LSPSITSTLTSNHVPLSLLLQDLQEIENTKEDEEEQLI